MQTLKFTIDVEKNSVTTSGFEKDGEITLDEAGLNHTDLKDRIEINEYFEERYGIDYKVEVEFIGYDFEKNFFANVEIQDLEKLGWEFDPTYEDVAKAKNISEEEAKTWENENYHVQIKVDEDGNTLWRTVNTLKGNNGIDQGSDNEETGDNEQTIQDLKKLHEEGKLWNQKNSF